jgi:hypothetical protein
MAQSRFFDQFETRQDIFNFVCRKLWEQNEISVLNDQCRYQSGNLKCAIGHLIPEDFYNEEFEGNAFSNFLSYLSQNSEEGNNKELFDFFYQFKGDDSFFPQMQFIMHDNMISIDGQFQSNLIEGANIFASTFNLTPYKFPDTE